MGFLLNGIDSDINDAATISIKHQPKAVSGFPSGDEKIPIQFPPRITDDSKSSLWREQPSRSFEPFAIWDGAGPRKISVELTYIVTGGQFTTKSIAEIAQHFKAYFYRSVEDGLVPVVEMTIYNHMTSPSSTWRLFDVNVSHGETIIKDSAGIFPLMTKIKVNAALITNINGKANIPNLPKAPEVGWY
jgi:hypothetical protein